jgi:hypothetical protein
MHETWPWEKSGADWHGFGTCRRHRAKGRKAVRVSGFSATGSPRGLGDGTLRSHPVPLAAWPIGRAELPSAGRPAGSAGITARWHQDRE